MRTKVEQPFFCNTCATSKKSLKVEDASRPAAMEETKTESKTDSSSRAKRKSAPAASPSRTESDRSVRPSRDRRRPQRFDVVTDREEYDLVRALRNSAAMEKVKAEVEDIDEAPTFRPTLKEFADPRAYIDSIRHEAAKYGICKIVPPREWNPGPFGIDLTDATKTFGTRRQQLNRLEQAVGFDAGEKYNVKTYKAMADQFYAQTFGGNQMSGQDIERAYWKIVQGKVGTDAETLVEYGNDIDSHDYWSGFPLCKQQFEKMQHEFNPDDHKSLALFANLSWNLTNLANMSGSVLRFLPEHVTGVTVPWVYVGMLYATFCWHNEDDYLYSVNYHHTGAPKTWYGIPGPKSEQFERVMKNNVPALFEDEPDLLLKLVTMISPMVLKANRVPVYHTLQSPGEFIITFPQAYHAGFSHGFNVAEAVNFATFDWFPLGRDAVTRYRRFGRESVFSHDLLLFNCIKDVLKLKTQEKDSQIDPEHIEIMLSELEESIREETILREAIRAEGIVKAERLAMKEIPNETKQQRACRESEEAESHKCATCSHFCYFSFIRCPCSDEALKNAKGSPLPQQYGMRSMGRMSRKKRELALRCSCLDHAKSLCDCPPNQKILMFRHSLDDLHALIDLLKGILQPKSRGGRKRSGAPATPSSAPASPPKKGARGRPRKAVVA